MKFLLSYIFTFLVIGTTTAQPASEVIRAFKASNVSAIAERLDNSVEITKDGRNTTYSKNQATKFLQDFFSENRVSDFKVIHQSESGGTAFYIGNLSTSGGNFRVTLFMKEKGGKNVLQEIRFER